MSHNSRLMDCRPEDVFAVLSDGWSFANWVVGAARIRDVEADWPAVESRIHHSVGLWPLLIDDHSEVEEVDPPHTLQLKVRAWPSGQGRVSLRCEATDGKTLVTMEEDAISGPARLVPSPLRQRLLHIRNEEALLRLAFLAERASATD